MPGIPIVDFHTPTSSFSIPHSLQQDTLQTLFDRVSRKVNTGVGNERVGPGWLKYEWNGSVWNLDDDADYAIFAWRNTPASPTSDATPTLHLHNPAQPLPTPPEYTNPAFYAFRPASLVVPAPSIRPHSRGARSVKSSRSRRSAIESEEDGVPKYKREFQKFHGENGVRTVRGGIGPIQNVRMLLKTGYRHVYISRAFAVRHGFIPADATPGSYGYSGLINIGKWPVTLGSVTTTHSVYLSEEAHFDVVLGRSFTELRRIRTDTVDPTSVICMDNGEKIDCEVVVIRDGRGEIVTVP